MQIVAEKKHILAMFVGNLSTEWLNVCDSTVSINVYYNNSACGRELSQSIYLCPGNCLQQKTCGLAALYLRQQF